MSISTALWSALDAAADDKSAWLRGRDVFVDAYKDPANHRNVQTALEASMHEASEDDTDRFNAGMDAFWKSRKVPRVISLKLIWGVVGLIVGIVLAIFLKDTSLIRGLAPIAALIGLVVCMTFAFTFIGDAQEKHAITEIEK